MPAYGSGPMRSVVSHDQAADAPPPMAASLACRALAQVCQFFDDRRLMRPISSMTTLKPAGEAVVAKFFVTVALPTPPLLIVIAIVRMCTPADSHEFQGAQRHMRKQAQSEGSNNCTKPWLQTCTCADRDTLLGWRSLHPCAAPGAAPLSRLQRGWMAQPCCRASSTARRCCTWHGLDHPQRRSRCRTPWLFASGSVTERPRPRLGARSA